MFLYSQKKYQSVLQAAALPSSLQVLTITSLSNTNISLRSRAKRFLTCRVQYTAKGKSSFNLARDVLVYGDIQANLVPGKTKPSLKYPCGECNKAVRNNQDAILCASCNKWSHAKCLRMSHTIFQYYLRQPDIKWTLASLNDSFFT